MLPQPEQEFVEIVAGELGYEESCIKGYLSGETRLPPEASIDILMEYGAAADVEVREQVYSTITNCFGERVQLSSDQHLTAEEAARNTYRLLENVDWTGSASGMAAGAVYAAQIFYNWRDRKNLVPQQELAERAEVSNQTVRNYFKKLQENNSEASVFE